MWGDGEGQEPQFRAALALELKARRQREGTANSTRTKTKTSTKAIQNPKTTQNPTISATMAAISSDLRWTPAPHPQKLLAPCPGSRLLGWHTGGHRTQDLLRLTGHRTYCDFGRFSARVKGGLGGVQKHLTKNFYVLRSLLCCFGPLSSQSTYLPCPGP